VSLLKICSSPEPSTVNVTLFGNTALTDVTKVSEILLDEGGPNPMTGVLLGWKSVHRGGHGKNVMCLQSQD
jgi:hypothetical protein